ncbi:MAG: HAD family hydrolase [Parachlamydiaceae bacterium]
MIFQPLKGIISLDIDGTLTTQAHEINRCVIDALSQRVLEGWKIIFITGRPFQWAESALRDFPFPYAIAVQNGAVLVEMPQRQIVAFHPLNPDCLAAFESICQEFATDLVVYSGIENDDWCYYRPSSFPPLQLPYLLSRASFLGEKWRPLDSFSDLPISRFTSIKFFTTSQCALSLSERIEQTLGMHAPPNRDPFNSDYFVIQVTHPKANKGSILKEFIKMTGITGPVIAAGDDYNDYTMLVEAHMKIVMANAPPGLLKLADIVAPPAAEMGIIQGLDEAIFRLN